MLNKVRKMRGTDFYAFGGADSRENEPALIVDISYFGRTIIAVLSANPDDDETSMLGVYGIYPESDPQADVCYFLITSYEVGFMIMTGMTVATHPEIFLMLERQFEKIS